MKNFVTIFKNAMELSCIGLYDKAEKLQANRDQQLEYFRSPLLKKALDKFSLLNLTYSLFNQKGEPLFPTNETALIKTFNFSIKQLIDSLPEDYRESLMKTEWYTDETYINIGMDNYYHCTPELLDKLNERIYRKTKGARHKELELHSQKFIDYLFDKNQDEYCEIRSFLQQVPYITGKKFIEFEFIRDFKEKFPDVFKAAYEKLNYQHAKLKVCSHCGLILKEMNDDTLYCVSDRCSKKTKGFTRYDEIEIAEESIWVLRLNVSRYIYYPGILERQIKKVLQKVGINPNLWPNKDEWDFEFNFQGERWVIDAKDVKDPRWLQDDIMLKEKNKLPYDKVIYVVPSDKNTNYLHAVNRVVKNKTKVQCITLGSFKRMMEERKNEIA